MCAKLDKTPFFMDDDIIDGFLIPNNPSGRLRTRRLEDGRVLEFHSVSNTLGVGFILTLDGQKTPDGRYTLNDGVTRFEVTNGLVTHEYYVEKFEQENTDILVDCSRINGFGTGCQIYSAVGPIPDGVYKLKRFKWVKVLDGKVVETGLFRIKSDI